MSSNTTTNKTSFQAGEAKGQAEEKTANMMDKAGNAAVAAKNSVLNAGEQVKQSTLGAVEVVKEKTGMNKK